MKSSPPSTDVPGGVATPQGYLASNRQVYSWAIGGMASHTMVLMFSQAANIFTVAFGLNAALVGTAFTLPRIIDALIDPWLGHFSDQTTNRWGRRKPFMAVAAGLGALFVMLLWWIDHGWPSWLQLAYMTVLGSCCYLCFGVYTMAWSALGYELADDYNERSRVAAIGSLFASLVFLANAWVYWLALRPIFGGEIHGIRWVSLAAAALIVTTAGIAIANCRERFAHVRREHTPIWQALRTALRLRAFVLLVLYRLFQVFGERVYSGLLFYLSIYYVCQGDKNLSTKITGYGGVIGTVLGFVLVPLIKPISQKIGKRQGLVIASGMGFALAIIQALILNPRHPYFMLLPTFLLLPLVMISNTLSNAIIPDICDLDELEGGERREGLFTSVMSFVAKLEISLTVAVVGYMVAFSGFNASLAKQPDVVMHKMLWLAILPNMVFTFLTFITATRFPMTEATMLSVRQQLDARRLAAAAAGQSTDDIATAIVHEHPHLTPKADH